MITADDSGVGSFAGSIFLDERADSIQLIKERVHIHFTDKKSHVVCKFWIYNYGESKKIVVGFPASLFSFPFGTSSITNFTCKVNGEEITEISTIILKEYFKSDDKRAMAGRQWYKWEMSIGKKDTILIENECDGNWRTYMCKQTFAYTIGTGLTWDGPVLDGRVTFDHSDLFSTNALIKYKITNLQLQPEYFEDSVVFSFSNYVTGRKEDIGIKKFQITWLPIDDSKSNPCPYNTVETVDEVKGLRNELFALHGYPFKDSTLLHYYQARKWYKMDSAFDSTKFSDGDIKFLQNLDGIEKRLNPK